MFDIPLMGEGTGSVEALPSYLHRCAYHHAVPTTKFLEYLHRECNRLHDQKQNYFKASQTVSMRSLLTYGEYPRMYVKVIKHLTGRNVAPATFLPLMAVVSQPQVEICRSARWCPECFKSIRDLGSEPYIKLIWHLSEVTHCPHHHTPLLEACPHCGADQNAVGRRLPLDVCHKCERSLSERAVAPVEISPSWVHQAGDLLRLLTHIPHRSADCFNASGLIKPEGLERSINDFSIRCAEPEFDAVYEYCWTNKDVRKQVWGCQSISLRTLRALAHLTNVDIIDLLSGNLLNRTKTMRYLWRQPVPEPLALNRSRDKHDHGKCFQRLTELARSETPLSLKEVARRAGLSIGYINYRFPVLKQQIVARYEKHMEQLALEKHHRAMQAALRYFNSSQYEKHPKSRKQALNHLLDETDLTKLYLKPAIESAYQKYQQQ